MLSLLTDPTAWAALASLTLMEIVLGIDNLVFISILTNKLPEQERARARKLGISAALVLRLLLLGTVAVIVKLTDPVFEIFDNKFSWRDLILIAGGLFLVWKATTEIHHNVDPDPEPEPDPKAVNASVAANSFFTMTVQILMLDVVFSIDSIITAVGMTPHVPIMVIAVVIAVACMYFAAEPLSKFLQENPTIIMLALGFLLLIGTTLIAEGFGAHLPKGYIYAAMAFAVLIEGLNMLSRRARRQRASNRASN